MFCAVTKLSKWLVITVCSGSCGFSFSLLLRVHVEPTSISWGDGEVDLVRCHKFGTLSMDVAAIPWDCVASFLGAPEVLFLRVVAS